jgi:3-ketoacyl-CoA synthase
LVHSIAVNLFFVYPAPVPRYALAYIEAVRGLKKGEKVLQVGVGSGVKCGICVWKANRDVNDYHGAWDLCLTPERRAALEVAASRTRLSSWHLTLRTLFVLLMALLLILVPSLLALMGAPAQGGAPAGVYDRLHQGLHSLAQGAHLFGPGSSAAAGAAKAEL